MASRLWAPLGLLALLALFVGCDDAVTPDGDADGDIDGAPDGGELECAFEESPVDRPELPDRPSDVDYLILSADHLTGAAQTHADWRDERGHRAEVISMSEALDDGGEGISDLPEAIERLRALVRERREALDRDRTMFVLLLGDAERNWRGGTLEVPPDETTGWLWEDSSVVTSDNSIADLDGDDLPDVAIGRIPATSNAQAAAVLRRTREQEEGYRSGEWNYQVHVFASEGGFSEVIDEMIEEAAFAAVREVPPEWQLSLTYARPGSPYAYPPALFSDRIYELLNSGSVMMAYIGHGWEEGFDSVSWEGETEPILDTTALDNLEMENRSSLLVLIACLIGSFDNSYSLAESFLHQSGGPTALLASTEISHPYANGVLIRELAVTTLVDREPTTGEAVLSAKRRMVTAAGDALRLELDGYAVLDPTSATPELREDLIAAHEHMYTLFGDPAHRIDYPAGRVELELERGTVAAGEQVRLCVQVQGPPEGHALVTLETERQIIGYNLPSWEMDDPNRDEVVVENNALANDKVLESWEGDYEGGGFSVSFPTSADHRGTLVIRAYVTEGDLDAIGSATVRVE